MSTRRDSRSDSRTAEWIAANQAAMGSGFGPNFYGEASTQSRGENDVEVFQNKEQVTYNGKSYFVPDVDPSVLDSRGIPHIKGPGGKTLVDAADPKFRALQQEYIQNNAAGNKFSTFAPLLAAGAMFAGPVATSMGAYGAGAAGTAAAGAEAGAGAGVNGLAEGAIIDGAGVGAGGVADAAAFSGASGAGGGVANLIDTGAKVAPLPGTYQISGAGTGGSVLDTFLKAGAGASVIGSLLGGNAAADAASEAANAQTSATKEAIQFERDALAQTRGDLQPFREAGVRQLPGLEKGISDLNDLTSDPNKQKAYIENNPFFKLLADDAQSRLFANQAAKGKVGSGETAKALQNSLLLLGQDLLNQDVNRRNVGFNQQFNLTTLGENAAARQGTATMSTANAVSDLTTQGGNAAASGIVGSANAKTAGMNSAINSALGFGSILSLSDRTMKKDIHKIGKDEKGLNLYTFKYKGDNKPRVGHMAQDVEKKIPDAVKTLAGIKFIDYGEVHAARS